jgi:hypothetical protein
MKLGLYHILAILLVFVGELLAVYAETFGVKSKIFSSGFWRIVLIMSLGGLFLILGYILGYKSYGNLWTVTVISITTLLIAEPLVIIFAFHQTPTLGAIIGFILGVIGLIVSLFF